MATRRVYLKLAEAVKLQSEGAAKFVDARWSLDDPSRGLQSFESSRVVKARFFDLESECGQVTDATGRHPLPAFDDFAAWLFKNDLQPKDTIVTYDDVSGASCACRLWWMLKTSGFSQVFVMEGSLAQFKGAGGVTEEGTPSYIPASVLPEHAFAAFRQQLTNTWSEQTVTRAQVAALAETPSNTALLDCRSQARFSSVSEPVWPDKRPGHIPAARSHPFSANFGADKLPLPDEKLREVCEKSLGDAKEAVVYCGSGVTACVTAAAFEQAVSKQAFRDQSCTWGPGPNGRRRCKRKTSPKTLIDYAALLLRHCSRLSTSWSAEKPKLYAGSWPDLSKTIIAKSLFSCTPQQFRLIVLHSCALSMISSDLYANDWPSTTWPVGSRSGHLIPKDCKPDI
ncbi:putative 3-mercaptopyruvate sulfurtransferase [Diplonema papillatum]|nr:putative 3-mercaptopyruvate sulfurtransferase [Diplonema papillatum]